MLDQRHKEVFYYPPAFSPGATVYWVGNSGAGPAPMGVNRHSTIASALAKCHNDAGDVIYVAAGHTENISSAGALTFDKAGVYVIGLGRGPTMPKFTIDTAAGATFNVTAENVTLKDLWLFSAYEGGLTAGITVTGDAGGLNLDGLLFTETDAGKEFIIGIKVAADCDDMTIQNCRYCGTASGSTTNVIIAAGGTDRTVIRNNYIHAECTDSIIDLTAAASTDLQILNNRVINIETGAGKGIDMHNSCTGICADNKVANLKDTVVGVSGTGMSYFENYVTNALTASGLLLPAADS